MLQIYLNYGIIATWTNRQSGKSTNKQQRAKMKTYKITYTYIVTTIKTGEIEIEAENADEARQEVSDNQREYDLYDTSNEIDVSRTFEIDDVQEVSNG